MIQSSQKFEHLKHFLNELGYQNVCSKLYPNRRHEIVNGLSKEEVYQDILIFLNESHESF